jgi:hypothetical protein
MTSHALGRISTTFLFAFTVAASAAGQFIDVPVRNWTVPPYRGASASGALSPMADISQAIGFTAITPCRVVDTRNAPGPYGGPALATNVARTFDINNGPCTGIPPRVEAYSLSIGGILAPADGFLSAWPTGTSQPLISQLNLIAGEVVANAAIVPAGTGGSINVLVNIGPTHVYIDINGYFTDEQNPGQSLRATSATATPAILGESLTTEDGAIAVQGLVSDAAPGAGSVGVFGWNQGASDNGYGVRGQHSGGGTGVFALSVSGFGVLGSSVTGTGIRGTTNSTSFGVSAVHGVAFNASGATFGVQGTNSSTDFFSAGVLGQSAGAPNIIGIKGLLRAGVRGQNDGFGVGVMGVSEYLAVQGMLMSAGPGTPLAQGYLGASFGTDPGSGAAPWAVFAQGDIGASGTKHFREPHPTDPMKVISYISLEGPEAGTYFRGRARFENGIARISVPEDFRMVTSPEGLTVQVTPIGAMATVGVLRLDLNEIVVQCSRSVEFSYLVQGVRASFQDKKPIVEASDFVPQSPADRMPQWLSRRQQEILIQNGTYNADGTVNMETAKRLGWEKTWEKRGDRAPQPESTP